MLYPKPISSNKDLFSPQSNELEAKYGLPQDVVFCSSCVYSNQKPNSAQEYKHSSKTKKNVVAFDSDNECDACKNIKMKQEVDWAAREEALVALCDKYRKSNGEYDCIVPGSGGKDSIYASHILKYKYGMNPLTVTFAPHLYTDWGRKNFDSWLAAGFDNYLFTPNKKVERLLTRLAMENLFHPFQPFMMGQMYLPPKMALLHGIELVFYGENPSDYGNLIEKEHPTKELKYFTYDEDLDDLMIAGVKCSELTEKYGLSKNDLKPYMPPSSEKLLKSNTEVHYLGYYLKWHPQECYYYSVENAGFEASPERTAGTYSKYSSIDDKIDDFHYYTTFIKFGIGRATYDAAQEVRSGDITREEAIALVRRYDGEFPDRFFDEILEYLSLPEEEFPVASNLFEQPIMDKEYFENMTDRFRSPHIWKHENNDWKLRKTVFE
ncbi:N-acetyl sugar amidotransferase [Curvivirga aplysinae]|uniref:N-acetyl sugar amidotransferase n=1 Tax=Curvivirga aplysinae TaxID=2529852 RepID=UPI0012BCD204|nr:N-acetyl sugar amidotransferase [Curvivirga aplysinae]MTI11395.1 N-acetyl sugar amidotransferase [Curvivirga aplysinae]